MHHRYCKLFGKLFRDWMWFESQINVKRLGGKLGKELSSSFSQDKTVNEKGNDGRLKSGLCPQYKYFRLVGKFMRVENKFFWQ